MSEHSEKPAGWFYVGEGRQGYRDDFGWTEFYMATNDPRTQEWPPPNPQVLLQQARPEQAQRMPVKPPRRVLAWRRRGARSAR